MNIESWWWKANPKGSGSLHAPRSDQATANMVFLAHLLILEDLDHHQNLISSSLYHSRSLHLISFKSVHNFLSNVVHKQTNKQTDKPTLPKHSLLFQGGKIIKRQSVAFPLTTVDNSNSDFSVFTILWDHLRWSESTLPGGLYAFGEFASH